MNSKRILNHSTLWLAVLLITVAGLIASVIAAPVQALDADPTATFTQTAVPEATATFTPTELPAPTATFTATAVTEPENSPTPEATSTTVATTTPTEEVWVLATSTPYQRPLITIQNYSAGETEVSPGNDFALSLSLKNQGSTLASNVIVTFDSNNFLPLDTGGVKAFSELGSGDTTTITQPMRADFSLWGYPSGTVYVNLSYTDINGVSYTETFTITIALKTPNYSAPTSTPTASPQSASQLVVDTYSTDIDPLQPGSIFNLNLSIHNLGMEDAKNVTMVLGGGVENNQVYNYSDNGQNGNGGLSGGSADLSHFAPLGTSNVIYLDSIQSNTTFLASVQLIVNVNTLPGAYPFEISFVYEDAQGNRIIDDQVITLLVYSLPKIEISFYRDPGILTTNQPGFLPIQIVNMGKTTTVLGNLVVTSDTTPITDNTVMIGALEPGGYFPMDASAWPTEAGPLTLTVMVNYTDDFNQTRTISQTLEVMIEAMPEPDFPVDPETGLPILMEDNFEVQEETFFQKVWRFIKGFFGFDSAKTDPNLDITVPEPGFEDPMLYGGKG